jgi:ferric-dicitrate binding protein FerR (iron transport regulator)
MTRRDQQTPLAEMAAQVLAAEELTAPPRPREDRSQHIAALERALRARARLRWLRWPAGAVALTAAAAAVLVVWWHAAPVPAPSAPAHQPVGTALPAAPSPAFARVETAVGSVEVEGVERQLAVGDEIAPGARLRVPRAGDLALRLDSGTRLGMSGGSTVRIADLGDVSRFHLERGSFTAQVAKLAPGRRFIVGTPDAELEVKGTRFQVAVTPDPSACDPSRRTSVVVQEGIVVVRWGASELRLGAGQRWPACHPVEPAAPLSSRRLDSRRPRRLVAHASPPAVASAAGAPAPSSASRWDPAPAPPPSSTLAEQNDLLAAALTAKRRGALEEAQRWLDRLLSRYPHGQLSDSARAERRRILELPAGKAPGP